MSFINVNMRETAQKTGVPIVQVEDMLTTYRQWTLDRVLKGGETVSYLGLVEMSCGPANYGLAHRQPLAAQYKQFARENGYNVHKAETVLSYYAQTCLEALEAEKKLVLRGVGVFRITDDGALRFLRSAVHGQEGYDYRCEVNKGIRQRYNTARNEEEDGE